MDPRNGNIWFPYNQMKTSEAPIRIAHGEGASLYDEQGREYIDAVSSWWTNIHGHAHPYIAQKLFEQASRLEHLIFSDFTHQPAELLAEKLLQRIPFHSKVFYSDNGSTAVEVAIKMALQFWSNRGQPRKKMIAFRDAYHGDTFGAMSVSARGVFTQPFHPLLFDVEFIDTPHATNAEEILTQFNSLILQFSHSPIAAFIFEPLVLGSSGMLMYSEQVLDELMGICKQHEILTIADEVMTGFGRTGKFLATDYCVHKPDIICLSKGITGGFLPFAATTCTQAIFEAFYDDDKRKMLFHGHSYAGNPLGCAAGVASLEVFEQEDTMQKVALIEKSHAAFAETLKNHAAVREVRHRGTILAIEIKTDESSGYLNAQRDVAWSYFIERRIILRPLGNVIYILPPYCIQEEALNTIYSAITGFLDTLVKK